MLVSTDSVYKPVRQLLWVNGKLFLDKRGGGGVDVDHSYSLVYRDRREYSESSEAQRVQCLVRFGLNVDGPEPL